VEEIIVIIVCLFLNACFAAYEMSFISVQRNELQALANEGSRRAQKLLKLRENPERVLSVVQIGITLVGAIAAAVGGAGASENLEPLLREEFDLKKKYAEFLAAFIVVVPITYFSVVVGEIVPKTLALRNPMRILMAGAPAFILSEKFLSPIVTLLEKSTKLFLMLFPEGKKKKKVEEDLPAHQKKVVLNLIEIEEKTVGQIYTKWGLVKFIDFNDSADDVYKMILNTRHTRLPVMKDGNVYGVLNTKEFNVLHENNDPDWQSLIRDPIKVKTSDKLLGLVGVFQLKHTKMAFVYLGLVLVGMVTFDDILEEVFGEIRDEDDDGRVQKLLAMRSRLK
jgi:putative hemolysin